MAHARAVWRCPLTAGARTRRVRGRAPATREACTRTCASFLRSHDQGLLARGLPAQRARPPMRALIETLPPGTVLDDCHLASEYASAASAAGLRLRGLAEPLLTESAVVTPAADIIPDANRVAFAGLPAVSVWDFELAG